tara:strand:- start:3487 stop:4383 length:897 start_codon:yes stop_codon:yes gene_type:complete
MSNPFRSVAFAMGAFCLFASLPAYVQLLQPLSGFAATGQRILWTVVLLVGCLLVFDRGQLTQIGRLLCRWRSWPGYLLGSALVGAQFWAFIWGPMNGRTLEVALGYFILPLAMVLTGRLVYGERLRRLQWLAVGCATAGVVSSLLQSGGFSWLALLIALGYPPYFILRRYQSLPALQAFGIENILLLPVAIWACVELGEVAHPFDYSLSKLALFAGLGLLGSIPMLLWLSASRVLALGVLGLLGNLEPTLIFCVGLWQGETVEPSEWLLYALIFSSLLLLGADAARQLWRRSSVSTTI